MGRPLTPLQALRRAALSYAKAAARAHMAAFHARKASQLLADEAEVFAKQSTTGPRQAIAVEAARLCVASRAVENGAFHPYCDGADLARLLGEEP